jgi:hypothetical protein
MLTRGPILVALMLSVSLTLAPSVRAEESQSSEVVLPTTRVLSSRSEGGKRAALPALQMNKLSRADITEPKHNPFAGKSWFIPSPLSPVASTPKEVASPSAPSLPFNYMGRIQEEGGPVVVFLTQDSKAYAVREGGAVDQSYRLESISPTQLILVYLPLNTKQTLNVSAPDQEPDTNSNEASLDVVTNVALKDIEAGRIVGSGNQ